MKKAKRQSKMFKNGFFVPNLKNFNYALGYTDPYYKTNNKRGALEEVAIPKLRQ